MARRNPSKPALLPPIRGARARARVALAIACDIHPLNNLRVLNYLTGTLGATDAQKDGWYRYWCDVGFEALETRLAREPATGEFCRRRADARRHLPRSARPTTPRVNLDLAPYPLLRIEAACLAPPAFANAHRETAGCRVKSRADSTFPRHRRKRPEQEVESTLLYPSEMEMTTVIES